MITAKEMARGREIDQDWIDIKWEILEDKMKIGRYAVPIGAHVVSKATSDEFEKQLRSNGFEVSYKQNSYNVTLLVVGW